MRASRPVLGIHRKAACASEAGSHPAAIAYSRRRYAFPSTSRPMRRVWSCQANQQENVTAPSTAAKMNGAAGRSLGENESVNGIEARIEA